MGREIRRVPPNWRHPRFTDDDASDRRNIGRFRPCYDIDYAAACAKWKADFAAWESGTHPDKGDRTYEFWEYDAPPERETCRPAFTADPTWWQVYETVSEGTPVTPAFPTAEALIDYLATRGDDWDQRRGDDPWTRENAERFVLRDQWAPSFVFSGGTIFAGHSVPHLSTDENRDEKPK